MEGYRSLITRPYEFLKRVMPGFCYSYVERTTYDTYYGLMEDSAKYDAFFAEERKFSCFECYGQPTRGSEERPSSAASTPAANQTASIDYDDFVYGAETFSTLVRCYPRTRGGLVCFLYEIILRRRVIQDKMRAVNSFDIVLNSLGSFMSRPSGTTLPTLPSRGGATGA